MNTWKAIAGIVILVVGVALFVDSYNQLVQCNSAGGTIVTAISTFFGGQRAQTCSDAQSFEIGGIVAAAIGLVVTLFAVYGRGKN